MSLPARFYAPVLTWDHCPSVDLKKLVRRLSTGFSAAGLQLFMGTVPELMVQSTNIFLSSSSSSCEAKQPQCSSCMFLCSSVPKSKASSFSSSPRGVMTTKNVTNMAAVGCVTMSPKKHFMFILCWCVFMSGLQSSVYRSAVFMSILERTSW